MKQAVEIGKHLDRMQAEDPERFVFLDETGVHLGMSRSHARGPAGQRIVELGPPPRTGNCTVIGAMNLYGMIALAVLDHALNALSFRAFVEQILLPVLKPGQIVVMDNLRVHYDAEALQMIRDAGCEVWFQPAYAPETNPIEEAWSQFKSILRRERPRAEKELDQALTLAANSITPYNAYNYYLSAGVVDPF